MFVAKFLTEYSELLLSVNFLGKKIITCSQKRDLDENWLPTLDPA